MSKYIKILFEDNHFIALNKSSGVLSIPDRFEHKKPNLKNELLKSYDEIFVVHRLDLETSGVILFAKTAEAHILFSDLLSTQQIDKTYLALSFKPTQESGEINAPIAESLKNKGRYKVHNRGKDSLTKYETLRTWQNYTLLSLKLITGRTHQIRVHLKYIGAPLIADEKYGRAPAFYLSQLKKINIHREQEERPLINRSSLHAYRLEFQHPITKEKIKIEAPLPKDMRAVINQLEKRFGNTENEPFRF
ncbi:MAG: 23S rRNA pseudouridine1911/1915/1917 synthase [Saprospiraceae bacterium]|jgi:23S rRNA pseudouridine1911/1915/1917 synthase